MRKGIRLQMNPRKVRVFGETVGGVNLRE